MNTEYEDRVPGAEHWRYRIGRAADLNIVNRTDDDARTVRMDRVDGLQTAFPLADLPAFTSEHEGDTVERLRVITDRLDERHPLRDQEAADDA